MVENNYEDTINSLFGKYERLGAEWSVYAWGIGITPEGVHCFLCDEETTGPDGEPVFSIVSRVFGEEDPRFDSQDDYGISIIYEGSFEEALLKVQQLRMDGSLQATGRWHTVSRKIAG